MKKYVSLLFLPIIVIAILSSFILVSQAKASTEVTSITDQKDSTHVMLQSYGVTDDSSDILKVIPESFFFDKLKQGIEYENENPFKNNSRFYELNSVSLREDGAVSVTLYCIEWRFYNGTLNDYSSNAVLVDVPDQNFSAYRLPFATEYQTIQRILSLQHLSHDNLGLIEGIFANEYGEWELKEIIHHAPRSLYSAKEFKMYPTRETGDYYYTKKELPYPLSAAPDQKKTTQNIIYLWGNGTNIRSEATTSSEVLGVGNKGDRFRMVGVSDDNEWVEINYQGKRAFIARRLVIFPCDGTIYLDGEYSQKYVTYRGPGVNYEVVEIFGGIDRSIIGYTSEDNGYLILSYKEGTYLYYPLTERTQPTFFNFRYEQPFLEYLLNLE